MNGAVLHTMSWWRSLFAWLGLTRHIAICGADLDAEPLPPPCPACRAHSNP